MKFFLFLHSSLSLVFILSLYDVLSSVFAKEALEGIYKHQNKDSVTFDTSAWRKPSSKDQEEFLKWYRFRLKQSFNNFNLIDDYQVDGDDQHACFPTQIHLALADQFDRHGTTSSAQMLPNNGMTVSFSISNNIHQECNPWNIQISIVYGTNFEENMSQSDEHKQTSSHSRTSTTNTSRVVLVDTFSALQYQTTSIVTNVTYTSDWIYHVALTDLIPQTKYWYSIHVSKLSSSWNHSLLTRLQGDVSQNNMATISRRKLRHSTALNSNHIIPIITSTVRTQKIWFQSSPNPFTRTKFAIVGDLGQTYNSTVTMLNILRSTQSKPSVNISTDNNVVSSIHSSEEITTSMVLCAGDMSYANSIQSQWDTWFTLLQPLVQSVPFHVAAGNHEVECDAITRLPFQAYENRFRMPNRIADAITSPVEEGDYEKWSPQATCATPSVYMGHYDYGNSFYSFEYGFMKVIVLSSYTASDEESIQYNWLLKELKSIQRHRERTPWVIVMMHTQFYTTFKAHNDEKQTVLMKQSMEPLFQKYGVNVIFSGHDHAYMRTKPMYHGKVNPTGKSPIYIIVGEGGNREGHVKQFLNKDPEIWVAVRDLTVFSFGTLDVVNATHSKWRFNMDGKTNGFIDDAWIENYITLG